MNDLEKTEGNINMVCSANRSIQNLGSQVGGAIVCPVPVILIGNYL